MRRFRKYTCKSCKGRTIKAIYKEITFWLRYALGMRQLLLSVPFLFVFKTEQRETGGGNGDYMIVCHEVCSIVHFLLVPAFKIHRPSSKLWVWIKFLITWAAAVSFKGFKGATMLLVVSFISFFLFCHRTGQCIVPLLIWKDSFILSTNI